MSCQSLELDATFAEIIPTLEKIMWTIQYGPGALAPESRESGRISMLTSARVEYHPVGIYCFWLIKRLLKNRYILVNVYGCIRCHGSDRQLELSYP